MSLFYEYKSCCSKKRDDKRDDRHDHERDCFCGKFLKKFIGETVRIFTKDGEYFDGRIACIDKETGIVTVASYDGLGTADGDIYLDFVCCKDIVRVRRPN